VSCTALAKNYQFDLLFVFKAAATFYFSHLDGLFGLVSCASKMVLIFGQIVDFLVCLG
jgi:hypothetical protein